MRIIVISLVVVIGFAAGYLYYLNNKLAPIDNEPAAKLVPRYFKPAPITWPVRHLDIGYAKFDVPATLTNALTRVGDSSTLRFESLAKGPAQGEGFIMAPVQVTELDSTQLLESLTPLGGRKYESLFELKKHAFDTLPPSVWSGFTKAGRKRMAHDLCLLAIKITMAGEGAVGIVENERIGLIATERGDTMFFDLHDKKSRSVQVIGFSKVLLGVKSEEVIASIFHTYALLGTEFSERSLRAALENSGFPSTSQPLP